MNDHAEEELDGDGTAQDDEDGDWGIESDAQLCGSFISWRLRYCRQQTSRRPCPRLISSPVSSNSSETHSYNPRFDPRRFRACPTPAIRSVQTPAIGQQLLAQCLRLLSLALLPASSTSICYITVPAYDSQPNLRPERDQEMTTLGFPLDEVPRREELHEMEGTVWCRCFRGCRRGLGRAGE